MTTLVGFILAMSIAMALIPVLMRWAVPMGLIDLPDPRKVHVHPVPRVGGLAMGAGVLCALGLFGMPPREMQGLIAGIVVLLVFGYWDDRKALPAGPKFFGQMLAVALVMFWGGVGIANLTPFERVQLPHWLELMLTCLFLVGGTNAFNLADGLDGLAGGMAMLCLSGTALLAFTAGNAAVGGVALVVVGAIMGFLRYNTHPALVFMGDAGSQVLGFTASVLAIILTQTPDSAMGTALPLLLLGVPLIDTLMVMSERLLNGVSPFLADRRHIHHRLLDLGVPHWGAVTILYMLQTGFVILAWGMRYASDAMVIGVFVLSALVIVSTLALARRSRKSRAHLQSAIGAVVSVERNVSRAHLQSVATWLIAISLCGFAAWVLAVAKPAAMELHWTALVMSVLTLAAAVRARTDDPGWFEKAPLYAGAAIAIALAQPLGGDVQSVSAVQWGLFGCMALAVALSIYSANRPFRITPLDVLVLLLVLTVPNLPNSVAGGGRLAFALIELVLVFYALETLCFMVGRRWRWLSGCSAAFLLILFFLPQT